MQILWQVTKPTWEGSKTGRESENSSKTLTILSNSLSPAQRVFFRWLKKFNTVTKLRRIKRLPFMSYYKMHSAGNLQSLRRLVQHGNIFHFSSATLEETALE